MSALDRLFVRRGILTSAILVLVALRVAVGVGAWDPVWSPLTWDDFTRVALARQWAVDPVAVPDLVWLPLHTWLLGSVFAVFGGAFAFNPMALGAVVHTVALVAAALVVGRTGFQLSGSRVGGMLVFSALLFSAWGFYLSLSGLGETLYYLSVAVVGAGLVAWTLRQSKAGLLVGTIAVALAAAMRYEGWWLAAAWAAVLVFSSFREVGWRRTPPSVWASSLAPFIVPASWMAVNLSMTGNPLFFAAESARYFESAYGGLNSIPARLLYYPASLLRSAPVLTPLLGLLIYLGRRNPAVRILGTLTGLHLALFYLTSLVSSAVGAFNERFMFAFVVTLLPVLATLPRVLIEITDRKSRRMAIGALAVLALSVTTIRFLDRPIEWTHSPDLLALVEELAEGVPQGSQLSVVIDEEMAAVESTPLRIAHGDRLRIGIADTLSVESATDLPDGWDLYVSRYPDATLSQPLPAVMVGRFAVEGPLAEDLDLPAMPCPCSAWIVTNEAAASSELPPGPFAWVEFTGDDPLPGDFATVATTVEAPAGSEVAKVEVRSTYGHGFNPGRMMVEVRAGGTVVESWDISEPSAWRTVSTPIPAGVDSFVLEVAVIALPDIEFGWGWGRASTVLVRSIEVSG